MTKVSIAHRAPRRQAAGEPAAVPRAGSGAHLRATLSQPWDVVIIGGGNAGLVSALSARASGASVLVLERAPLVLRGGNSRHTRNIRCVHDQADRYYTGSYSYDEMWRDLCSVGKGPNNEELAALTLAESTSLPTWMTERGVNWQASLTGTLQLGRTNRFFLGGGKALLNTYYRAAREMGIHVLYDASVEAVNFCGDRCVSLTVQSGGSQLQVSPQAIVCASGGFEANVEWLEKYWGQAARNYHIRGPVYNDGTVLRSLLDSGAASAGDERGFHAVAVDARSPRFDGGIATRIDSIPFGVTVDRSGRRFYDEGEDIWPKRYAIWGGNIARQEDQIAYSLWDAKVSGLFLPPMYGAYKADSISALAALLDLNADQVSETIRRYNAATPDDATARFNPALPDGVTTSGLFLPKSNWAQPLDTPPFYAVPMRPGVTFTYLGVEINRDSRIIRTDGTYFKNVFAAGEMMSGNILSTGYLAGFGLTIGTVWGRIAGREAARHALR